MLRLGEYLRINVIRFWNVRPSIFLFMFVRSPANASKVVREYRPKMQAKQINQAWSNNKQKRWIRKVKQEKKKNGKMRTWCTKEEPVCGVRMWACASIVEVDAEEAVDPKDCTE